MENQHKKITGYRELNQSEIDLMNEAKALGNEFGALIEQLQHNPEIDHRWLAIAKTDLQTGVMALVRCIAKPYSF